MYFRRKKKQWISVSLATLLVLFQEILISLGWVGFSVAAVQLVPYCFFLSPIIFDLINIKQQRVAQKLSQDIHDCAFDACVLVISTLTLPVSLHSFHSQHPLSHRALSLSSFLTHVIITELEGLD